MIVDNGFAMTLKLIFAEATISQHAEIDRLMLNAFTPYVQKLDGGPVSGPYPWLEAAIISGVVFVALEQTQVVGVVTTSCRGDEFFIDQLGVDPEYQGRGIGSWLLNQIEQIARQNKMKKLTLQTAEIMLDILRLYDRHGFKKTHKAPPDHGEDNYLRVHMTKVL